MSVSDGANELETAVAQHNASANVQDEPAKVLEASEDRLVHFVFMTNENDQTTAEVSFSSQFTLNQDTKDEISSGVLAVLRRNRLTEMYYDSAPPVWEAGEEINLHVNNQAGSEVQNRVIIGYEPIGEFRRERLRNR